MKPTKSIYVQPRYRVITLKDSLLSTSLNAVQHESFGRGSSVEWEDETEGK